MKKPTLLPDSSVLAVIHRAGDVWRGLIATTRGTKPALLAHREFAADRITGLDDWFDEHQVGSVLCVLPSSSVICRNCTLPDAPAPQLEQALRLQTDAHLAGVASPHRIAFAVLPSSVGEANRSGIILAWPESAEFKAPETSRRIEFTPDISALAAILNGHRGVGALLWLDRSDGSVALAAPHSTGVVFRSTREDAESVESWQRSVGRIVVETGLSVNHSGPFVEFMAQDAQQKAASLQPQEAEFFAPPELINAATERINGLTSDPKWWSKYGIAAGALVARFGQLAPLTHMLDAAPIERPSRIVAVVTALARPRVAAGVAIACLLALMFGPLVMSAVHLGVLKLRFGDMTEQLKAAEDASTQIAMYRELQTQHAWPITKVLADIANSTPVGIDIEQVRIESGKEFTINGLANAREGKSAPEVVSTMEQNLRQGGMCDGISTTWGNSTKAGSFKFDMHAKIARPYKTFVFKDDYAIKTLRERLFGPPPDNKAATTPVAHRPEQPATESAPIDTARVDGSSSKESGVNPAATDPRMGDDGPAMPGSGADALPTSLRIPEPLTQAQIDVMSASELNDALTRVADARKYNKDNKELQERLKREWDMIFAAMRKVKGT